MAPGPHANGSTSGCHTLEDPTYKFEIYKHVAIVTAKTHLGCDMSARNYPSRQYVGSVHRKSSKLSCEVVAQFMFGRCLMVKWGRSG